jgi:Flp pilus assembly protein TadD
VKAKLLLGMSYYGTAQYGAAIPPLEFAVNASPDNLQLRTTLAQSCLWAEKYNCTLEQYKQILLLNPESAQAYMLAGEAEDGLGDTVQAIAQFRAAAKVAPNEPDLHFGLGYLLWKQRQFDEAEAEFKLELEQNPNHPQALAYLGDIAIKRNDEASAMSYLQRAVAQPDRAIRLAYVDLGILDAAHGQNEEAVANFQHAIQLDPDEADAHWRLARLYQAMGKKEQASAELATVNKLHKVKDEGLVRQISGPAAVSQPQ